MAYYMESRQTPIRDEYDVIVVGGGPAGVGAALAAARGGKRTLLVERFGFLGGMWTAGLINPLFDYENKGGIVQEIVNGINALGMNSSSGRMYTFDIEAMKLLLDRMMIREGVELLFHTYFADAIVDHGAIRGILVENKSGRQAYMGKIVVDCTGDGDVAARAGAPFRMGRDKDGATQPMTMQFKLVNMDFVQNYYGFPLENGNELYFLMKQAVEREGLTDYRFNFTRPCMIRLPGAHTGVCQMTHIRGRSAIDARELTLAEIEGRELVNDAVSFFKRYLPQFKDAHLDQTGAHIGVRETRRITGEYEITLQDMLNGARFADGFCICAFGVDIHQPDGDGQEGWQHPIKPYHIPYRSLVPKKVENLLVAGRCISGCFEAHASYRVTGDCVAMGQAAGTAASEALDQRRTPRELDGRVVVAKMVADGALR